MFFLGSGEEEVTGILEKDFVMVSHLESVLISDLFDHFVGISSLLANIEDKGGIELATFLSKNEKFIAKCDKFAEKHQAGDGSCADYFVG